MNAVSAIVRLADAVTSLADAVRENSLPKPIRTARHQRAASEAVKRSFADYQEPTQ